MTAKVNEWEMRKWKSLRWTELDIFPLSLSISILYLSPSISLSLILSLSLSRSPLFFRSLSFFKRKIHRPFCSTIGLWICSIKLCGYHRPLLAHIRHTNKARTKIHQHVHSNWSDYNRDMRDGSEPVQRAYWPTSQSLTNVHIVND